MQSSHKGSHNPRSKLAESDVLRIRERLFSGTSAAKIALSYEVSSNAILDIRHGRTWDHLPPPPLILGDALLWRRAKRDVVDGLLIYEGPDLTVHGTPRGIQDAVYAAGFDLRWSCGDHFDLFCIAAPDRLLLGSASATVILARRFHNDLELPPFFYGVARCDLFRQTDQSYADPEWRPTEYI